jgi:hypothetical protein
VVTVTEDSPDARTFSARVKLPRAAAAQVTYGFGYLAHRASLPPAATSP